MRVARETYVLLARFRDDTVKKEKGSRQAPFFLSQLDEFKSGLCRVLVMMVMTPASAVPSMMAIMRGSLVGCLRRSRSRTILWSRLQRGGPRRRKQSQRASHQKESRVTFHGNSPERNPL